MLRPKLAQDAPPTRLTVGGVDFDINVDYRVWIGVLNDLREIILHPSTPEHALHNATIIMQLETAVFGRLIDAQVADVLKAPNSRAAIRKRPLATVTATAHRPIPSTTT